MIIDIIAGARPNFMKIAPIIEAIENAAMQKPILLGVEGEAKGIIERYKAGICFEPENEKELILAIEKLMMDVDFYDQLKIGCANLARDFDRIKLADSMLEIIKTTFNKATKQNEN